MKKKDGRDGRRKGTPSTCKCEYCRRGREAVRRSKAPKMPKE